jgi:probable HAF family extracellular repeat protein
VVVGWAENAEGQPHAFRWTAAGGMEDLNITYAHLLTNGSKLYRADAISPDGRYIVGQGYNAATGRPESFLLDTRRTWLEERSGAPGVRLRLLPQPAHERVVLELEVAEAARGVTLVVTDALGRVVACCSWWCGEGGSAAFRRCTRQQRVQQHALNLRRCTACSIALGGNNGTHGNLCAQHHGQGGGTPMARSVAGVGGGSVGGVAQSGTTAHLA